MSGAQRAAKEEARDALAVLLSFTEAEEDQRLVLDALGKVNNLWPDHE